jgi:hypothetical protein
MRIDYIENSKFEPTNINVLWLNEGTLKYWKSGWQTINGTGEGSIDTTPIYKYIDKQDKALTNSITNVSKRVEALESKVTELENREIEHPEAGDAAQLQEIKESMAAIKADVDMIKSWYNYQ